MTRKNLISLLLLLILLSFLSSGCWGKRELEETGFVLAMGLDSAPDDRTVVTLQIAIPANLAPAGGGGGGQGPPVLVQTLEGKILDQSLRLAQISADRRLDYSHNKVLIIGEELAKKGIADEMDLFTRNRQMRRNILIMVAKGKSQDILKVAPEQEKNPADYLENLARLTETTAVAPLITLHDFTMDYALPGLGSIAPLIKQSQRQKEGKSSQEGEEEQKISKLDLAGTAIFTGDRLKGTLNMTETQGLIFLRGEFKQAIVSIPDPKDSKKRIAFALTTASRKIRFKILKGQPVFDIDLVVEGDLGQVEGDRGYVNPAGLQQLQKSLSRQIEKQANLALKKCQQDFQVDCLGLGEKARETMSYREWEKYNWEEKFPQIKIKVHVKSYIRRVGLTYQPLRIPPQGQ